MRRWGDVPVVTVGYEAHPITSMGGLRVLPAIALTDLVPEETRLLAGICAQCAPGYQSPGLYVEALTVRDRGVISDGEAGAQSHPISVALARQGFCPTRHPASAQD